MTGRVLSEEDLVEAESTYKEIGFCSTEYAKTTVFNLIATIRDRDKTIAELQERVESAETAQVQMESQLMPAKMAFHLSVKREKNLKKQNALMLSALERMSDTDHDEPHWYMELATDTIAQVKSKHREQVGE